GQRSSPKSVISQFGSFLRRVSAQVVPATPLPTITNRFGCSATVPSGHHYAASVGTDSNPVPTAPYQTNVRHITKGHRSRAFQPTVGPLTRSIAPYDLAPAHDSGHAASAVGGSPLQRTTG